MDSFRNIKSVKLTEGLGDCLIAGASVVELATKINFKVEYITNVALSSILLNHPKITYRFSGLADYILRWPSQLKSCPFELHTSQRFSHQLGFYIEPTKTLELYTANGIPRVNINERNFVCINTHSTEKSRRFIPQRVLEYIEEILNSYKIEYRYIGANHYTKNTELDIAKITEMLEKCIGFIGPVSFPFHLAGCLGTPSLLVTNYMPAHKVSHFKHTDHLEPAEICRLECEKNWESLKKIYNCEHECKVRGYNFDELKFKVIKLIS